MGRRMVVVANELSPPRNERISVAALAGVIVRSLPWIFACALIALLISVAVGMMQTRTYTARVSFVPQGHRVTGFSSGLAAQLGIGLPSGDAGQSPAFYVDL